MDIKTVDEIRTSLIGSYEALVDLDVATQGTVERDVFVEAPIEGQLLEIWSTLDYLQKLQSPLMYEDDLLDSDKDLYCRNHGVGAIDASYASGELLLYTYTTPAKDIYLDPSYQAQKSDGSVSFKLSGYYTIIADNASAYYNATTSRYEITVSIIATTAGTVGNVGANTITKLSQTISGIDGCTNVTPITNGTPAGTLSQRMAKVKEKFKGRNLGNIPGIKSFVSNYATGVNILRASDPLVVRNEGLGGGIDIYVKGSSTEGYVDSFIVTSTGLANISAYPTYTTSKVYLTKQPVLSVSVVLVNDVVISSTHWQLVSDTGDLKGSTRARDYIELTATGIAALGLFEAGDKVEIRYNYNYLLTKIETLLNSDSNLYEGRDYLVRAKGVVKINFTCRVKLYENNDLVTVQSAFSTAYSSNFDSFTGNMVELADLVDILKRTAGVDNIALSSAAITASDGRATTTEGDIEIGDNEYPVAGTINLVEWTRSITLP